MQINSQNAKKIDSYINSHPECKDSIPDKISIQDKNTIVPVYRIPINLLFYNVENGRFAAEYLQLKKKLKRELHSEDLKDAQEIEDMLREQSESKTEWLKNDIKENDQQENGIITHDGYVINGNRRMSVLSLLAKENSKFGYLNVARLPISVSESDLYKIEINKQMARDQKLDYGPINELLKIKQGLESKLTIDQIAKTIGFSVDEITERLAQLELIEDYLDFIGEPDNYKAAENLHNHFINLQNILSESGKKELTKRGLGPIDILNLRDIAFSAIKGGITHLEIRKISGYVKNPKIQTRLLGAKQYVKNNNVETVNVFRSCDRALDTERSKDRPGELLVSILDSFDSLDLTHPAIKEEDNKKLIKKIIAKINDLTNYA